MGKAEILMDNLLAVTFLLPRCNALHLKCSERLIPPWFIHSKGGNNFGVKHQEQEGRNKKEKKKRK